MYWPVNRSTSRVDGRSPLGDFDRETPSRTVIFGEQSLPERRIARLRIGTSNPRQLESAVHILPTVDRHRRLIGANGFDETYLLRPSIHNLIIQAKRSMDFFSGESPVNHF